MAFCGEASSWSKLSLLLTVLGFVFHCVGFGTNYWMVRNTARDNLKFGIGLWKMTDCSGFYNADCKQKDIPESPPDDPSVKYDRNYVDVVKTMESLAIVFIFGPMFFLVLYVGSRMVRTRRVAVFVMLALFFAAAFIIIGMIVWLAYLPEFHYPGWSLGLTVFASTLCITAAILMIPDIVEYDYRSILKVGGEFQNLPATSDIGPPQAEYRDDIKPVVEAQGLNAAPVYQFLNYDKRRKMDGF